MRRYRVELLISLILVLATLALYGRGVLRNDFVNYDDPQYVANNPPVQAGLTWHGFLWAWTTTHMGNWHPLNWLSLQLDTQLYGWNDPRGFHATNLLLHAGSVVLLFWALRRMTGSVWPSALVAALFAWHPLNVESVMW